MASDTDYVLPYQSGATLYVVIRSDIGGSVYNFTSNSFEAYTPSDQASYAQPITDAGGGWYVGNFPSAITTPGTYYVLAYDQTGGTPSPSDAAVSTPLEIQWTGTVVAPVVGPAALAALADVKALCGVSTTAYDALFTTLIARASGKAREYCHRGFTVQDYTEIHDLDRPQRSIFLRQFPVVAVSAVTIRPCDGQPISLDPTTLYVNANTGELAYERTTYSVWMGMSHFPRGYGAVEVSYSAGFAQIPDSVQYSVGLMVKQMFHQTQGDYTLMMEQVGASNGYRRTNFAPTVEIIMTEDVKAGLKPYRNLGV